MQTILCVLIGIFRAALLLFYTLFYLLENLIITWCYLLYKTDRK